MGILTDVLKDKKTVVILGHVNPDGDCIGSCLAMYNYLTENCGELDVSVYLEPMGVKFGYLKGYGQVKSEFEPERIFDLCITLDVSDEKRLGEFAPYLKTAADSLCIDHHITNQGLARVNVIAGSASSTCEVLYGLLDQERIGKAVAECLYTGIVHDTGVFKFSCTSAHTMEIAGKLMGKGIDFGAIIDNSFYRKTYIQNQILGRALLESITFFDGRCIFSAIRQSEMEFYGVDGKDMDGIIDQLRLTEGVEVAIFLYETGPQEFKVSMRSQYLVDVSRIAAFFGGGGHVRAAGCSMSGSIHDVINNLSVHIARQLDAASGSQE